MFRVMFSSCLLLTPWRVRSAGIAAVLALGAAPALAQVTQAWVARFSGPVNREDYVHGLAVDSLGNVYVTGGAQNDFHDDGAQQDYATVKYDSNGNQLWLAYYSFETWPKPSDDSPGAIAVDGQGNVYVTGGSLRYDPEDDTGTQVNYDVATIKYDTNGNLLWVRRWNGTGDWYDRGQAIAVDSAGNVYVAIRSDWEGKPYIGPWETVTIKYDANGTLLWTMRERTMGGGVARLSLDAQANVTVASTGASGAAVVKYDTNGNRVWLSQGPAGSSVSGLTLDGQGNAYVAGSKAGNIFTAKYAAANGNQLWTAASFGGEGTGIGVDGSGNVFVSGNTYWIDTNYDWTILKYDATGNQTWNMRYDGPISGYDNASALVVDGSGAAYVTGFVTAGVNNGWWDFDFQTIKVDAGGNLVWGMNYGFRSDCKDYAWYIALDTIGNVYVTGPSATQISNAGLDFCTIKYSVPTPPVITDQPDAADICMGSTAGFSVTATGAVAYQWRRNSNPLVDGADITGATTAGSTTPTLSIHHATSLHAGPYDCVVTNGPYIATSNAATLNVWNSCLHGDMNCDQAVNGSDVAGFVQALLNAGTYTACNLSNGDINHDGVVDGRDIDPFIHLIIP